MQILPLRIVFLFVLLLNSFLWLQVTFFQFVPASTHCPSSRPVEELLDNSAQFSSSDDREGFTHVLLTVKTEGSSRGDAHTDIADAGGRFLIDLKRVGVVITEGMRYQPLAVEPTASVVSEALWSE